MLAAEGDVVERADVERVDRGIHITRGIRGVRGIEAAADPGAVASTDRVGGPGELTEKERVTRTIGDLSDTHATVALHDAVERISAMRGIAGDEISASAET